MANDGRFLPKLGKSRDVAVVGSTIEALAAYQRAAAAHVRHHGATRAAVAVWIEDLQQHPVAPAFDRRMSAVGPKRRRLRRWPSGASQLRVRGCPPASRAPRISLKAALTRRPLRLLEEEKRWATDLPHPERAQEGQAAFGLIAEPMSPIFQGNPEAENEDRSAASFADLANLADQDIPAWAAVPWTGDPPKAVTVLARMPRTLVAGLLM